MTTIAMVGFKQFRLALRTALSRGGFDLSTDIACLNYDQIGLQIIISGNDYFLGAVAQLTMPIASKELEEACKKMGFRKKLSIGKTYAPLVNIDILKSITMRHDSINRHIVNLNWNSLVNSATAIAEDICDFFSRSIDRKNFLKSQSWPLSLSPEQAAILSVGSYKIGGIQFLEEMYNITHGQLETFFGTDYLVLAVNDCIKNIDSIQRPDKI